MTIVFVECSRVRATALVVLWRAYDGVEAKQMVAHTCFLVLFSYQPSAPKNEQVPLTPAMSTHPTALLALQARLPKGCYSSMDHNASGIEPPTPTDSDWLTPFTEVFIEDQVGISDNSSLLKSLHPDNKYTVFPDLRGGEACFSIEVEEWK